MRTLSTVAWRTRGRLSNFPHYLKANSNRGRRGKATQDPHRKLSQKLPRTPARTRFAPSPTGHLHLGSLRTALFNYLLAKATGGQFLLRIEDTDQLKKRTVPGAEDQICRDLEWAGLQWDEGPKVGGPHGPYKQSERTALYRDHADQLIRSKHAYRCFCSSERLHKLAKARAQLGLPTDYDRTCAGIPEQESADRASSGEAHTVRLKVPDKYPNFDDLVYGSVGNASLKGRTFKHGQHVYEDPILLKSDGLPTYHLANVVDDHLMRITHVVRAVEWMPSTPKHLAMYDAFGWEHPSYAHVGLLQGIDRQKLSKRNLDIDIQSFRDKGIFPAALVNHVALLGWSHALGNDFLPLQQLIENFDLKFTKGNTIVNFQKLDYLQKLYARKFAEEGGATFENMVDQILALIKEHQDKGKSLDVTEFRGFSDTAIVHQFANMRDYVRAVLRLDIKQYTTPDIFFERIKYFFDRSWEQEPNVGIMPTSKPTRLEFDMATLILRRLGDYNDEVDWTATALQTVLDTIVEELASATKSAEVTVETERVHSMRSTRSYVSHWLRKALMNGRPGPGIVETMVILGPKVTLLRLTKFGEHLTER